MSGNWMGESHSSTGTARTFEVEVVEPLSLFELKGPRETDSEVHHLQLGTRFQFAVPLLV